MIVWGSEYDSTDTTGGRYNPVIDSWTPIDEICAPAGRWGMPAIWTGSAMMIWGGETTGAVLDDGYEYDPVNDSWRKITRDNAPTARADHTAVWTGGKILVWGGSDGSVLQDGGTFTP